VRLLRAGDAFTGARPIRWSRVLPLHEAATHSSLFGLPARLRLRQGAYVPENVLLVPGVQFDGVAVLADGHDAQEPQLGVLPEPVREQVGQVERQVPALRCRATSDDPAPPAHIVDTHIELA